jgi:C4-dicarboxylate transporter DctM subunit
MAFAYELFGLLFLLLFIGVPISVSLGTAVIVMLLTQGNVLTFPIIAQRMFTAIDSFPLMAIPFFVLAGNLMEYGGISYRLVAFIKMLLRKLPAASACITTAASAFFGAISGSSPATVAAIGGIMIPSMIRAGYKKEDAATVAAASGSLGVVIPPSIPMVTYAVTASVSIGTLFMAGFIPGILLSLVFMGTSIFLYGKQEKADMEKITSKAAWKIFTEAIFALGMPLIILGGIYGGIFTPTESASVACVYSLLVGIFIYKDLKVSMLRKVFLSSAKMTAAIMFVISLSAPFAWLMTSVGLPRIIATTILTSFNSKIMVFIIINFFLLFLGCFMETQSIILLVTPILLPIAVNFGVNPISLGVIIVVNTALGMITPPMAPNIFVATGIAGLSSIGEVSRKILLYLAVGLMVLLLLTYAPDMVLSPLRAFGLQL